MDIINKYNYEKERAMKLMELHKRNLDILKPYLDEYVNTDVIHLILGYFSLKTLPFTCKLDDLKVPLIIDTNLQCLYGEYYGMVERSSYDVLIKVKICHYVQPEYTCLIFYRDNNQIKQVTTHIDDTCDNIIRWNYVIGFDDQISI